MTERIRRPRGSGSGSRRRSGGPSLARSIAVRVLERVERVQAYADIALHHALAQTNLSSLDRALATELVYGTLRWRGRLDYLIDHALDRGLAQLEPLVVTILRVGAYQIVFSDRIPDSAAVDESVRCARALGAGRSTGLVNAVLRRLSREAASVPLPELSSQPLEHLCHALSLPRWLAERWLADYGPEQAAALARACNAPAPLTIRANRLRIDRDALCEALREPFPDARSCRHAPWGIVLGRKGDPGREPRFLAGDYSVQDEASQLVVEMLDPQPGEQVLDVCAAPGTKTTAIAEALAGKGEVLALDRNPQRLNLVGRAARRLGLTGIRTLARDASQRLDDLMPEMQSERPGFDRVLVDAPCSGLGSLRRNPDARWRVRPTDPPRLAEVQRSILAQAAGVLRVGGRLVYSTCTVLSEENDAIVRSFLTSQPRFRLVGRDELPPMLAPVLDAEGFLRCLPHIHDCDGFFAACLERRS